jgi:hypothetical protein
MLAEAVALRHCSSDPARRRVCCAVTDPEQSCECQAARQLLAPNQNAPQRMAAAAATGSDGANSC